MTFEHRHERTAPPLCIYCDRELDEGLGDDLEANVCAECDECEELSE